MGAFTRHFSGFARVVVLLLLPATAALSGDDPPVSGVRASGTTVRIEAVPSGAGVTGRDLFTVAVHDLPVQQLLHAIARDVRLNVEIHPAVDGRVSMRATRQPLREILERAAGQAGFRYQLDDQRLVIEPDVPFVREYTVDQLNLVRRSRTSISSSTSIASAGTPSQGSAPAQGNASSAIIDNLSDSQPWKLLEQNLRDLLRPPGNASAPGGEHPETASPEGGHAAADIIIHAEAGVIAIRASARQHERVRRFLDSVQNGLGRQVAIEATLVEVALDRTWQGGVDWTYVGNRLGAGVQIGQQVLGTRLGAGPSAVLTLTGQHGLSATLKLLETFGKTRVLSSPRVSTVNNQLALLKVVDEKVYFEIRASRTEGSDSTPSRLDYSSSVKSVPVGVMMSVLPQISPDGMVTLSVRPTITRITSYRVDPAAALLGASVSNMVPEIQVREIESTLRLRSGHVAVLGGLMQEVADTEYQGIPGLMHLPLIGPLFRFQRSERRKTELVIFLRPTVTQTGEGVPATAAESEVALPAADHANLRAPPTPAPAGSDGDAHSPRTAPVSQPPSGTDATREGRDPPTVGGRAPAPLFPSYLTQEQEDP